MVKLIDPQHHRRRKRRLLGDLPRGGPRRRLPDGDAGPRRHDAAAGFRTPRSPRPTPAPTSSSAAPTRFGRRRPDGPDRAGRRVARRPASRQVDGVADAAPSVEGPAQLVGARRHPASAATARPPSARTGSTTGPLNAYHLVEGRAPARPPAEVVIDRRSADHGSPARRRPAPWCAPRSGPGHGRRHRHLRRRRQPRAGGDVDVASPRRAGVLAACSGAARRSDQRVAGRRRRRERRASCAARVQATLPAGTEAITGGELSRRAAARRRHRLPRLVPRRCCSPSPASPLRRRHVQHLQHVLDRRRPTHP